MAPTRLLVAGASVLAAATGCGGHAAVRQPSRVPFHSQPYSVSCVANAFAGLGVRLFTVMQTETFVSLHRPNDDARTIVEVTVTRGPEEAKALVHQAQTLIRTYPKRLRGSAVVGDENVVVSYVDRPHARRIATRALERIRTRCRTAR
jgi:hypothetical protein